MVRIYMYTRLPLRYKTNDGNILEHICKILHMQHIPTRYGVATISRLLKIIGLIAKEPYKRDYILQERPLFLRSLLIVATPYTTIAPYCMHMRTPSPSIFLAIHCNRLRPSATCCNVLHCTHW